MIRDPELDRRGLVRQVLRAERELRKYRPAFRPYDPDPPHAPPHADDVITAVAASYPPGSAVGLQQVIDCIGVTWEEARAVRDWGEATGCWPWLRPSGMRPAGRSDPGPGSRKKGGGR